MSSQAHANPAIAIDVTDLASSADLKSLISPPSNAVMQLESLLGQYAGRPVSSAVGRYAVNLALTASPSWKTASGIAFSLKPEAKCSVTIAKKADPCKVALQVDSADTTDVQLPPADGMTYVNIDLDFDITGAVSGSGTVGSVGISGKASGSAATTVSFSQPVPSDTETAEALKLAFSSLVFPTAPDSALRMTPGSSCRMNFDGKLNCSVDATYGIADHKLSAPSAGLVVKSILKAWSLTGSVKVSATASVKYAHTDHFGLVVEKQDADTALLYLVRSAQDEFGESVGVTVGISSPCVSTTLDPTLASKAAQDLTGSAALSQKVGSAVTQGATDFNNTATAQLKKWASSDKADMGLSFGLDQQKGRTALFNFKVDLTHADLAQQSWKSLLAGDIAEAMSLNGFALMAGSGVAEQLKHAATLQFHFFNLFSWSNQQDFFDNSYVELEADNTIRICSDIGIEDKVTTKQALDKMSFHFTAFATEDTKEDVSKAEIDLHFELSEKGDSGEAVVLAKVLGMIDQAGMQSTIDQMSGYAPNHPKGTLGLSAILKPSAYRRLTYSPYAGNKPPVDQTEDNQNWNAIHDAAVSLMGLDFVQACTYSDWGRFNSKCNTGSEDQTPNRRHIGDLDDLTQLAYFFVASADGMNLFEDLATLAADIDDVTTIDQWNKILQRVTSIVKGDANIDYAKPIAAAVLAQAAGDGAQTSVSTAQGKDDSTFTATVTIA